MNTVLISGASRGLGLEMTRQYLQAGWKVLACCRSPESAKQLNALTHPQLQIHKLDVLDDEDIRALAAKLHDQPIDILINNAGILKKYQPDAATIDRAAWLESFQVNTIAPTAMATAFVKQVAMSEQKLIANVSSTLGSIHLLSNPEYLFYGSSKAALNYATKNLSLSLKSLAIKVVCIHPGWVKTDMGGQKAPLSPEESIANIRKVLAGINAGDSGNYYDHEGNLLPY